ncbi:MAG: sigma-70 family RNA polymerase sigma factor [Sulfuritalea sp.]|nr:sigma-70 family RNA polymerase sigma factor [Sulfuritalea sp.]
MSTERLQELLIRGLDGDSRAYGEFLSGLSGHLRGFLIRRLSGFPSDVEDLVQETLLAVHTKRHTYDRRYPMVAWVHAIAKYKLVDYLRARGIRDALNDPLDQVDELFSDTAAEAIEARRDIMKLLDQLPAKQRMSIVHTKLEGLSVEEAARLTGMSESALKVGVHRGLKALAAMVAGK